MTGEERARLVLDFARVLYVNGQATEQTVAAAERLGHTLGLQATIIPRWGQLQLVEDGNGRTVAQVAADPAGVEMDRVASALRAIDDVAPGGPTPHRR